MRAPSGSAAPPFIFKAIPEKVCSEESVYPRFSRFG